MTIQTYNVGLAGRLYRTEKCIFIEDSDKTADLLKAVRTSYVPANHKTYLTTSEILGNIRECSISTATDDICKDVVKKNNDPNTNLQQKSLRMLRNKCCIFL